jgi:hypothetical protein
MYHSICLCNTVVSSHQFHTWDHEPLCLCTMRPCTTLSIYTTSWSHLTNSIHETMDNPICLHHHGLFSPILYMRPWTTLSVYTTSWSLLINFIHETRHHSICLQHHGLLTTIPYMRPWTTICLYNIMVSSH